VAIRATIPDFTVLLDGRPIAGSTTIAAVGAYALVIATALPPRALTLTSTYLGRPDGAIATSHLQLGPSGEDLAQHVVPAGQLHATVAGACLLDHAATLRDALATATSATVTIDVGLDALERAADAWGPPAPPG
jgi:hypothetical protein